MALPELAAIDEPTWKRLDLKGAGFALDPADESPPRIIFKFGNPDAARHLFAHWRSRFGPTDEYGVVRISIVEGRGPDGSPLAALVIGTSMEGLGAWAGANGVTQPEYLNTSTIAHPVTPRGLDLFKDAVGRWGEYDLAPITVRPNGQADLDEDHTLRTRHIRFRKVNDLRRDPSDHDAAALEFLR